MKNRATSIPQRCFRLLTSACLLILPSATITIAFSPVPNRPLHRTGPSLTPTTPIQQFRSSTTTTSPTSLYMSDRERSKSTQKGTKVKDRLQTKSEEKQRPEEMWRVVLHNDEVHTFNYVIRSLTKCIGTLDRQAAFEICVQTHGVGKATITKTWKKQAEQHCLGLQRQGLTVSISPDEDFDGGHAGGGL